MICQHTKQLKKISDDNKYLSDVSAVKIQLQNSSKIILSLSLVIFLTSGNSMAYGMFEHEKKETYKKGESLFTQGKYQEALLLYDEVLDEDPNYADALGAKGAVFHRLGDLEMALKYYDRAISINSTNPYFLSDKGNALLLLGDDTDAEKSLQKSLEIFPDFLDALNGMASVYSYRQDYQKELLYRQAAQIVDPENLEAIVGMANAFYGLKKYEKALQYYSIVLEKDQANANALIGIGNTYRDLGKYQEAMHYYNLILKIDPKNTNALRGSSLTHLKMGNINQAVINDQEARNIDSQKHNASDKIPSWVKNLFGWYYLDIISEKEILVGIEYLIENKILIVR